MLNTCLSIAGIAVAVAALVVAGQQVTDASAAEPGHQPAASVSAAQGSVSQEQPADDTTMAFFQSLNATIARLESTVDEAAGLIRNLTERLAAVEVASQAAVSINAASGVLFSDVTINRVSLPGVLLDHGGFEIAATSSLGPVIQFVVGHVSVAASLTDAELAAAQWLDGVEGIAGNLNIASNGALTSLTSAFPDLTTVGGYLHISSNGALTSLGSAFPGVTSVGGGLAISSNGALTSLGTAFANLTTVGGYLHIYSNGALTSLTSAFPDLTTIGGDLHIVGNGALTTLGAAFSDLTTVGGELFVALNNDLASLGAAFANLTEVSGPQLLIFPNNDFVSLSSSSFVLTIPHRCLSEKKEV